MLHKYIHVSWRIALASAGFVAGVASALYIQLPPWVGILCFVGMAVCVCMPWNWVLVVTLVASLFWGNGYGNLHRLDDSPFAHWVGAVIEVRGVVKEDPSRNEREATLYLHSLTVKDVPLEGTLWTRVPATFDIVRGDEVKLAGTVGERFGTFVATLENPRVDEVVRPVPGDTGRVVREWFSNGAREAIPEPQVALGMGFLTGQKSALSEELSESLRIAGLTHIVVASGYNLTILVRLARRLFVKHSVFASFWSAAGMIAAFVSVTGLSPSMTRAGLVSGLSLVAWRYGRVFHPLVLLPLAAAITVAIQPSYAWGDVGWQLSFAAFAGVMIVAPLFHAYFFGRDPPGTIRQVLGETLAAHIVTLPIIVLTFGTVSNVAIFANLLIVPLVPLAMLGTFIAGCAGLIVPGIAEWIGLPVTWLLGYMIWVAEWFAELPWAQTELTFEPWMAIAYIVVLVGLCWWAQRQTGYSLRSASIVD